MQSLLIRSLEGTGFRAEMVCEAAAQEAMAAIEACFARHGFAGTVEIHSDEFADQRPQGAATAQEAA